jgi:hypothetical protein
METQVLLAKFWGLYMVIAAGIFIIKPGSRTYIMKIVKEPLFGILAGFIALILGLIQVVLYSEWNGDIYTILTIFGYAAILKGILLIGFPEYKNQLIKKIDGPLYPILLVIMLVLGIVILWYGTNIF